MIHHSVKLFKSSLHMTIYLCYSSFDNFVLFYIAEQQAERALSLSLAALLGDDVYNFGELVWDVHV